MPIPLAALENPNLKAWAVKRTYVEDVHDRVYAETQEEALAKAQKEAPTRISEDGTDWRSAYLVEVQVERNTDPYWREANSFGDQGK